MKTMRFCLSAFALAAAAMMTACAGGVDVTDQKSVDQALRRRLEAKIDPATSVLCINLTPCGHFGTRLDQALVTYVVPGTNEVGAEVLSLDRDAPGRRWAGDPDNPNTDPGKGMKLAAVDFSSIAARVNLIARMFGDEGHEFSGVEKYIIHLDPDPMMVVHEVWANSVTGKERKVENGRNVEQTNFYRVRFLFDAEGNAKVID